ncbi:MAG: Crp/Fnr family transcriptional regulator [Nitrospirota bacterium]|nr:Crp/Fnr family transcriptional regulator [Nitrospirota bacterium]MDE3225584.1 Crp/Fnr family transcriptional regulator [Nitrospirota bacterium]MDE3243000.1 Crp/Fnr family transcriptional regulator [Nitrospirota bacterium]
MAQHLCTADGCEYCTCRSASVLCNLPASGLASLTRITHRFHYGPRETVFYEGHACLGLYLLSAGKVKLTRSSVRGERRIVRILTAGQLLETHAFQNDALHLVTCETLDASQICLIEREGYVALVRQDPQLAVSLIHLLSGELQRQQTERDSLLFQSARERLATLLLELVHRFGRETGDTVELQLALKREELAELLGVTMETAIRLLSTFRREGLVHLKGRTITVLNQSRLARIARRPQAS